MTPRRVAALLLRLRAPRGATSTFFQRTKDVLAAVQAIATIVALVLAGYWFWKQRQTYPRIDIDTSVHHFALNKDWNLLTVDVSLKNLGVIVAELPEGQVRVTRVTPLTTELESALARRQLIEKGKHEPEWAWIDGRATEPTFAEAGEVTTMHEEFAIPSDVTIVSVYSYFRNIEVKEGNVGWAKTVVYNLAANQESSAGSLPSRGKRDKKER